MPIYFSCPKCNFRIGVPRRFGGKRGQCPECKDVVRIPESKTLEGGSTESQKLPAVQLTASSEQELINTLAPDAGGPRELTQEELEAERQRIEFEKAKLEYDRRRLESGEAKTSDPDEIDCPDCAETIKAKARICRFCGCEIATVAPKRARRVSSGRNRPLGKRTSRRRKGVVPSARLRARGPAHSPGLACFLSFLVPGFGQIYAGDAMRGLAILSAMLLISIASFFTAGLGCIVWFPLYVWQMVDAYQLASRPAVVPHMGTGRVVAVPRHSGTGLLVGIGLVVVVVIVLGLILLYGATRPRDPVPATPTPPYQAHTPSRPEATPDAWQPVREPARSPVATRSPSQRDASAREEERARRKQQDEEQAGQERESQVTAEIQQIGHQLGSNPGLDRFLELEERLLAIANDPQVRASQRLKDLLAPVLATAKEIRSAGLRDLHHLIETAQAAGDERQVASYLASLAKLRPLTPDEQRHWERTLASLQKKAQTAQAEKEAKAAATAKERVALIAAIEEEVRDRAKDWFEDRDVRKLRCRDCDGAAEVRCGNCGGQGSVRVFDPLRQQHVMERCGRCGGRGIHPCRDDLCMDGYRSLSYRTAFWNYLSPAERADRDRRDFYRQLHAGQFYPETVGRTLVVRSFDITGVRVEPNQVLVDAVVGWNRSADNQTLPTPESWTSVWIREDGRYYLKTPGAAPEALLRPE